MEEARGSYYLINGTIIKVNEQHSILPALLVMVKGPKPGYDERPDRYLKYLYWQLIVEKALAAGLLGRIACPTKEGKEGLLFF